MFHTHTHIHTLKCTLLITKSIHDIKIQFPSLFVKARTLQIHVRCVSNSSQIFFKNLLRLLLQVLFESKQSEFLKQHK